jgi:hypothetical protein
MLKTIFQLSACLIMTFTSVKADPQQEITDFNRCMQNCPADIGEDRKTCCEVTCGRIFQDPQARQVNVDKCVKNIK